MARCSMAGIRYTIANLLNLDLEVREYDGDPVQLVIAKNLHRRRHLTAVQRSSCTSAAHRLGETGSPETVMQTERDQEHGSIHHTCKHVPSGETGLTSLDHEPTETGSMSTSGEAELRAILDHAVRLRALVADVSHQSLSPSVLTAYDEGRTLGLRGAVR